MQSLEVEELTKVDCPNEFTQFGSTHAKLNIRSYLCWK